MKNLFSSVAHVARRTAALISTTSLHDPTLIEIQRREDDGGTVLPDAPRAGARRTIESVHWHRSAAKPANCEGWCAATALRLRRLTLIFQ
jgi:hypothetical protein